jgi:hypothetical protein
MFALIEIVWMIKPSLIVLSPVLYDSTTESVGSGLGQFEGAAALYLARARKILENIFHAITKIIPLIGLWEFSRPYLHEYRSVQYKLTRQNTDIGTHNRDRKSSSVIWSFGGNSMRLYRDGRQIPNCHKRCI